MLDKLGQRLVKTGLHYDTEHGQKGHGRGWDIFSPQNAPLALDTRTPLPRSNA